MRFQPRLAGFHQEVGDEVNHALEAALFTHSALSEGDWVEVAHMDCTYDLKVLKLQPAPQVSVIGGRREVCHVVCPWCCYHHLHRVMMWAWFS